MTNDDNPNPPATGLPEPQITPKAQRAKLLSLPGVMAISVYMILLAVVAVVAVFHGHPLYLLFSVLLFACALGLLLLLRWAWALALAAVALLAGWCFWVFVTQHVTEMLVQGLLNLVFFLYLVRTDVREKLH